MSETIEDQPAPTTQNNTAAIWDLVIEDMKARDRTGRERYKTPLQAFNGRNALVDLYQEILDAAVYARQAIEEQKSLPLPWWQAIIGNWSVRTFGEGLRIQPHIEHIRKELRELEIANESGAWITEPAIEDELADVQILLFGLAHRLGVNLEEAVATKHKENLTRKWGSPDKDGVIEHIRDEQEV